MMIRGKTYLILGGSWRGVRIEYLEPNERANSDNPYIGILLSADADIPWIEPRELVNFGGPHDQPVILCPVEQIKEFLE